MKKVIGFIEYDVHATCPYCFWPVTVSQAPYNQGDKDELGIAIFGSENTPGKWKDLNLEYQCYHCKKKFILNGIEY